MHFAPDSYGTDLREVNRCHGKGRGHPCPGKRDTVRASITSARSLSDPNFHRSNKMVGTLMRMLETKLKTLPGVRAVSVKPALGQWGAGPAGREFSWAVSYIGNGEARKELARVGKQWNQDAVLILRRPKSGETPDPAVELVFDGAVGMKARNEFAVKMQGMGLQGWSWYKRNGQTTLRLASVPQWGSDAKHFSHTVHRLTGKFERDGHRHTVRYLTVKAEVMERGSRDGVPSYEEVLRGA